MVGMALVCLPCTWHLWRRPTLAVWGTTPTIDAAMLLTHAQLLTGGGMHHAHRPAGPLMRTGLAVVTRQLVPAGRPRRAPETKEQGAQTAPAPPAPPRALDPSTKGGVPRA